MATVTPNLNLELPLGTENVSRQLINSNNTKIDTFAGNVQEELDNTAKEVTDLKDAINGFYDSEILHFVSGGMGTDGSTTDYNTRIRIDGALLPQIGGADIVESDGIYEFRVGVYNSQELSSSAFVTYLNDFSTNPVSIPAQYQGKYAGVVIRKENHASDNISNDLDIVGESIKYYRVTGKINNCENNIDMFIKDGNNLLSLDDCSFTRYGISFTIKDGVITVSGTSTENIRLKISNGYDCKTGIQDSWKTETLPQFESGKTYSIHNYVISGVLPSNVGVSIRNSEGSSVISVSIPEVTLSAVPAFGMFVIPIDKTINCSFIPMFIEGHLSDESYDKKLNPVIKVEGIRQRDMPDLTASFIYDSTLESAIKLPTGYKAKGEPTPLIILAHGLSSTISASTWGGTDMMNLVNNFVGEGFAVIDVNQVTTQDWCNPALIGKYVAAIRSAVVRYNVVPAVVYGESMGCLIGLCLAKQYNIKVCVISGIRLDFSARYEELTAEQKAIVDANLGFTDGFDAYKAAGWDRLAFSCVDGSSNKIAPVQFPPTFFVVGSTDTLTKTESLAKIDEIKRGGTICKTTEYTGNHNAVCYLKPEGCFADVMNWINKWM